MNYIYVIQLVNLKDGTIFYLGIDKFNGGYPCETTLTNCLQFSDVDKANEHTIDYLRTLKKMGCIYDRVNIIRYEPNIEESFNPGIYISNY